MTKKKTAKTGKLKVEIITWLDHCSWTTTEWSKLEDTQDLVPLKVTSIGQVVKETKDHLVIVSTLTEGGHTNGEMCIIKGCIVKRTKL